MFRPIMHDFCIKCGKPLSELSRIYCNRCETSGVHFEEGRAVFYYDDVMRKSIYQFKYNRRKEYAEFYAKEIVDKYSEKISRWNIDVIIPIPIHKSKLKKRGYNQAYLIAKELSCLIKIPVDTKILKRVKNTKKQKNLGALGRESNLKNAFKISPNRVQYLSAMLIDDIYTTGATMNNATRCLKSGGIEQVFCMSVSAGLDISKDWK